MLLRLPSQDPFLWTGSDVRIRDPDMPNIHFAVAFKGASWSDPDSVALMVMQVSPCHVLTINTCTMASLTLSHGSQGHELGPRCHCQLSRPDQYRHRPDLLWMTLLVHKGINDTVSLC